MNVKLIAALAVSSTSAYRMSSVGQSDVPVSCHELPGSTVTCGSHCWPNCETTSNGQHPDAMDFNHYLVIPEARSCYIDTIDYGRFDAFMSINSQLNVTMDVYTYSDGICGLSGTNVPLVAGALEGDEYCQMYLYVEMPICNGCPDYQRRLEIYSNKDTGCGLAFYREEPEDTDQEDEETITDDSTDDTTDDTTDGGDSDPAQPPIEGDSASKTIVGSAALFVAAAMALY